MCVTARGRAVRSEVRRSALTGNGNSQEREFDLLNPLETTS
jgi:hypothetical protein